MLINIVNINEDGSIGGCAYHRQLAPTTYLTHTTGIPVFNTNAVSTVDFDKAKVFTMSLSDSNNQSRIIKHHNKPLWVDFDDTWDVETRHPLFDFYKKINYQEHSKRLCQSADIVTCTTEHLAEKISKFNKNVIILPNFISPVDEQFMYSHTGYKGGLVCPDGS